MDQSKCIYVPDRSLKGYSERCGVYDIKYNRNEINVESIIFDRSEYEEPPIKAFQGDFFRKMAEFHPINNVKRIEFISVEFEGNMSEDFFQPVKDSLRIINFHQCILNELPKNIFKNLELDSLFFTSNTFSNFRSPFLGNKLKNALISFKRETIYSSL